MTTRHKSSGCTQEPLRARAGFTLMEILVAMTLLSVVAAIGLSSFSSATKVVPSRSNTAFNIARKYFEQFYEYVREDNAFYYDPGTPLAIVNPGPQGVTQTLDGVAYTTTYVVNPLPNGVGSGVAIDVNGDGKEDYRRVTMTVTWPNT